MGKNYKQLSIEERMIQTQLSMVRKLGQIARELGHSAWTLSCELKRNGWTRPLFFSLHIPFDIPSLQFYTISEYGALQNYASATMNLKSLPILFSAINFRS